MIRFRHFILKHTKLSSFKGLIGKVRSFRQHDALDMNELSGVNDQGAQSRVPDDLDDVETYTPSLPAEIWIHIISFLKGQTGDLFSLCHASGTLRALVLPIKVVTVFPEIVYMPGEEASRQLRTLRVFREPHLASTVTEFHVSLPCLGKTSRLCTCNSMDDTLGAALWVMVNLSVLEVICMLCPYPDRVGRHHYLNHLEPRRWRHVSFQCSCTEEPFWSQTLLAKPIFRTVEAVRWSCRTHTKGIYWNIRQSHPGILPSMTALAHLGGNLENELLSRRPIRRLCSDVRLSKQVGFLNALESSPGRLTHIVLEMFFDLRGFVEAVPHCFANIQHIGTLPIPSDEMVSIPFAFGPPCH